ncbi:MAG TPA: hypothetical protein VF439_01315 [Candidatus Paceibacterota bacterium]
MLHCQIVLSDRERLGDRRADAIIDAFGMFPKELKSGELSYAVIDALSSRHAPHLTVQGIVAEPNQTKEYADGPGFVSSKYTELFAGVIAAIRGKLPDQAVVAFPLVSSH